MARTQKFSEKEYREALEANDWNKAEVARQLGVNVSTVSRNIKRFGLERYAKAVIDRAIGKGDGKPQVPFERYEKSIEGSFGILSDIAKKTNVTYNTLKSALKRWPELQVLIDEENKQLVDIAQSVIVHHLEKQDRQTAQWVLERRARHLYSKAIELSGPGGEALFSPALLAVMKEKDIELSVLIAEFERLMLSSVDSED